MDNEILEDDLIAVTAATLLYVSLTGDRGVMDALRRISTAMQTIEDGDVRVVKCHGLMDPNVKARMRMAEAFMGMEE